MKCAFLFFVLFFVGFSQVEITPTYERDLNAFQLKGVGDLNGDGFDDFVTQNSSDGFYLVFGAAEKFEDQTITSMNHVFFNTDNDRYTYVDRITGIGDFTGDGYNDLAIGAPWTSVGFSADTGKVAIVSGRNSFPESVDNLEDFADVIYEPFLNDGFGYAVHGVGDMNGDGHDDIAIYKSFPFSGRMYVLFGGSDYNGEYFDEDQKVLPGKGFIVENSNQDENDPLDNIFRMPQLEAGDLNADGLSDFIIGLTKTRENQVMNNRGQVWVLFGTNEPDSVYYPNSFDGVRGFIMNITSEDHGNADEFFVSVLPDFNGDGYVDLAISANYQKEVYLFFDLRQVSQPYINQSSVNLIITQQSFATGMAVADLNADGKSDLIVMDYNYNKSKGRLVILFGGQTGIQNLTFFGNSANNSFAVTASSAGDLNNDGYEDFLVSAPANFRIPDAVNKLYIFYGPIDVEDNAGGAGGNDNGDEGESSSGCLSTPIVLCVVLLCVLI